MTDRQLSKSGKRRQLAGSRKGSAVVRETFDSALTRRRYCELVGIHPTTLAKWEDHGVVEPEMTAIMNSPTRVFREEDVAVGRAIIELLRRNPGKYSVTDAARLIRDGNPEASA